MLTMSRYHAHYQSQISDGLFGAIYIRPRSSQDRPFNAMTSDPSSLNALLRAEDNPHFVMLSDWQHVTSNELMDIEDQANVDIYCAQSLLFNGVGSVQCLSREEQQAALPPPFQPLYASGGPLAGQWLTPNGCAPFNKLTQSPGQFDASRVPQEIVGCQPTHNSPYDFRVNPDDQWASFLLIGAVSILAPVISLDHHDLWVYAVDGRYIEPYRVQGLQIFSGERYSVMVQLNQPPATYTFRASHFGQNQLLSGFATVTYTSNAVSPNNDHGGSGSSGSSPAQRERRSGIISPSLDLGISLDIPALGISIGKDQGQDNDHFQANDQGQAHHQGQTTEEMPGYFTYGGFPVSQDVIQLNTWNIVPFPNIPPSQTVDATHIFMMSRYQAPWLWTVTGTESYPSFPTEYAEDDPMLYNPHSVEATNRDLVVRTQNDTWVDLVLAVTDAFGPPHPMHKHSNKMYIIGQGTGNWTWNSVAEAAAAQPQNFNFYTPQFRDGAATAPSAGQPVWMVARYHVVNPGAFLLHCHIQTHLAGGMAVALLDGVEDFPPIPQEYRIDGNGMKR